MSTSKAITIIVALIALISTFVSAIVLVWNIPSLSLLTLKVFLTSAGIFFILANVISAMEATDF